MNTKVPQLCFASLNITAPFIVVFLMLFFTAVGFAENFKTLNGKEYKDATITRVEPDGIVVKTKSGITKVYFTELPKEVQEHFHYDPQKASAHSAEQAANYSAYQKQQEEAERQRVDAAAKKKAILGRTRSGHKSHSGFTNPLRRASETGR